MLTTTNLKMTNSCDEFILCFGEQHMIMVGTCECEVMNESISQPANELRYLPSATVLYLSLEHFLAGENLLPSNIHSEMGNIFSQTTPISQKYS